MRLDRFDDEVLEYIAKTIADCMTGSELTRLFECAGYPNIIHDGSTKWKFLYSTFKDLNEQPDGQYHIAKIIQTFCKPTQWIANDDVRKNVINDLNKCLIFMNLQFNEAGELIISDTKNIKEKDEILTISPIFKTKNIKQDESLVFVLIPFKPSFDRIYKDCIKPVVEYLGFKCIRANDIFLPTPIIEEIWTYILKSKVIIADVTDRNPNVFYEMGIAHAIGKQVIIITQNKNDVPFDISHIRYFVYTDTEEGWLKLRNDLILILQNIQI